MRKLPPLRSLECFEQTAAFGSFSRAGEAIGMSHGAISHQIRGLENWLSVRLFERYAGGVRLTEDGQRLKQACTLAFSIVEQECSRLRSQNAPQAITVGCSATFLVQWLLPRAESFASIEGAADVNYQTRVDIAALTAGRVDALITSVAEDPPHGIEGIKLTADRIGPVCATGFQPRPQVAEDIASLPLLHALSRPTAWNEWAIVAGVELPRERRRQFETLSLTIEAARGGLGLAMTPEFLVRADLEAGTLVAPLGFIEAQRSTWIFFKSGARSEIKQFADWVSTASKVNSEFPSPTSELGLRDS